MPESITMDREEVLKRIEEARVARQQMTADLAAMKEKLTLISEAMPMFLDMLTRLDQRMHRIEHQPVPLRPPEFEPAKWATTPMIEYHMLSRLEWQHIGGSLVAGDTWRGKQIVSVDYDPIAGGYKVGVCA